MNWWRCSCVCVCVCGNQQLSVVDGSSRIKMLNTPPTLFSFVGVSAADPHCALHPQWFCLWEEQGVRVFTLFLLRKVDFTYLSSSCPVHRTIHPTCSASTAFSPSRNPWPYAQEVDLQEHTSSLARQPATGVSIFFNLFTYAVQIFKSCSRTVQSLCRMQHWH
jgi:hypothetical protein